jgi:DNA-binding MarR family transcriptional regulator
LTRARQLLLAASELMAVAHDLEQEVESGRNTTLHLEPSDAVIVELARQIYHARQQRSQIESCADLFGEPAWDMLLELFIATHEQRDVPVTRACLASGVPNSTALRVLAVLQERGIVVKQADPHDRRRAFVRLSPTGLAEFNGYFRAIADAHAAFVTLRPSERAEKHLVAQS